MLDNLNLMNFKCYKSILIDENLIAVIHPNDFTIYQIQTLPDFSLNFEFRWSHFHYIPQSELELFGTKLELQNYATPSYILITSKKLILIFRINIMASSLQDCTLITRIKFSSLHPNLEKFNFHQSLLFSADRLIYSLRVDKIDLVQENNSIYVFDLQKKIKVELTTQHHNCQFISFVPVSGYQWILTYGSDGGIEGFFPFNKYLHISTNRHIDKKIISEQFESNFDPSKDLEQHFCQNLKDFMTNLNRFETFKKHIIEKIERLVITHMVSTNIKDDNNVFLIVKIIKKRGICSHPWDQNMIINIKCTTNLNFKFQVNRIFSLHYYWIESIDIMPLRKKLIEEHTIQIRNTDKIIQHYRFDYILIIKGFNRNKSNEKNQSKKRTIITQEIKVNNNVFYKYASTANDFNTLNIFTYYTFEGENMMLAPLQISSIPKRDRKKNTIEGYQTQKVLPIVFLSKLGDYLKFQIGLENSDLPLAVYQSKEKYNLYSRFEFSSNSGYKMSDGSSQKNSHKKINFLYNESALFQGFPISVLLDSSLLEYNSQSFSIDMNELSKSFHNEDQNQKKLKPFLNFLKLYYTWFIIYHEIKLPYFVRRSSDCIRNKVQDYKMDLFLAVSQIEDFQLVSAFLILDEIESSIDKKDINFQYFSFIVMLYDKNKEYFEFQGQQMLKEKIDRIQRRRIRKEDKLSSDNYGDKYKISESQRYKPFYNRILPNYNENKDRNQNNQRQKKVSKGTCDDKFKGLY